MPARAPRVIVSAPAFGLPSASPPIQVPQRSGGGAPGQQAPVVGEQALGRVDEALLEEPVAVADLVDDAGPPRPHLVRLPVRGDLAGERRLDLASRRAGASSGSSSSASRAAIRRCEASTVRRVASVGCAVRTSCERDPPLELLRRNALEPGERVVERLRGHAAPRACRPAAGEHGDAARRRSRAGNRARTPAARSPGARAASASTACWSSSCGAPARDARASARTRSTSASSDSPSCSTRTRPSRSPSRRTSAGAGHRRVSGRCHASSVGWNSRKTAQSGAFGGRAALASNHGSDTLRQGLGQPSRRSATRGLPELLYVDLHLVHEVTSPQAFEGLRLAGRAVRRPDLTLATMDHNVVTGDDTPMDELSAQQLEALQGELRGVRRPALRDRQRARGHRARDRPGARRHAAGHDDRLRRLAHLDARRVRRARVRDRHVRGRARARDADACSRTSRARCGSVSRASCRSGATAKDIVLAAIGELGVDGGVGYVIEYAGPVIEQLSMEGRLTICNMSIEAGARAGMIAPDETTFAYLAGRPGAPKGAAWEQALERWRALPTDDDAVFDKRARDRRLRARLAGHVGHEPGHGRSDRRRRARSRGHRRRRRARSGRARARLHGARARHADPGDRGRPRVHRLVHELADRGPARGRRGGARAPCASVGARDGRPRLCAGEAAGGGGGSRPRSSSRPASNGGAPAARCASA